jgi:hypothetical protein
MTTQKPKPMLPIILYEEPKPGDPVNPIPYIEVPKDGEMPKVIFISEYKETGEFEIDAQFGSAPIVDMLIHQFVGMTELQRKLDPKTYDKVRTALGLMPLKQARKLGAPVLEKVYAAAGERRKNLESSVEAKAARAFTLGEDFKKKAERFLENEERNKEEN